MFFKFSNLAILLTILLISLFANEYFIPQCSISIDMRTYFWINKKYREENNYILSDKTLSVLNKLDAKIIYVIYFENKRNIKK